MNGADHIDESAPLQKVEISSGIYRASSLLGLAESLIFDGFSVWIDRDGLHGQRTIARSESDTQEATE